MAESQKKLLVVLNCYASPEINDGTFKGKLNTAAKLYLLVRTMFNKHTCKLQVFEIAKCFTKSFKALLQMLQALKKSA